MLWLLFWSLLVGEEGSEESSLVEIRRSNPCPKFGSSFSSSSSCARKEFSLQNDVIFVEFTSTKDTDSFTNFSRIEIEEGKRERWAVTYRCHDSPSCLRWNSKIGILRGNGISNHAVPRVRNKSARQSELILVVSIGPWYELHSGLVHCDCDLACVSSKTVVAAD